ncbi:hypothetical protein Fcan01_25769 [Folsomia candida]|uniref:CCHC-type domain-containing protein n=1 Tax=Folsomia candida TaxID=158441 RepID=A0A226D372_FOLCA|nr:hypothetical protein Fcan01_25765 [Folsomia candida]OXA39613.1 hypothetical protein Fcan01_25769 [Folsomia candida]
MPLWNFFSRRTDPSPPPSNLLEAPESVFVSGRRFDHLRDPIDPDSDREHQIVSPTDSSQCGVVTDDFGDTNSDPLPLSHLPSAPDPDHSASSILPGNINDNLLNNQVRPPSVTFIRENQPVNFVPTPEPSCPPNPPPPPPANTFFFGPRALNPDAVFQFPSSPSPFIRPPPPNRPPVPPPTPAAATANMAARNFFTGSPPQPAPLVNINLEMPKYGHELSKLGLRLFIQRFQRWAEAKRLTVPQAKLTLPLAFSNATAQHYFTINFAEQDNPAIDWATFINNFLTKCPMEVDDHTSVLDLLKSPNQSSRKHRSTCNDFALQCLRNTHAMQNQISFDSLWTIWTLPYKTLTPQLQPPVTIISPTAPPQSVGLDAFAGLHQAPVTPLAPPTAQPKPVNYATDGGLSLGVNLTNVKNMQGLLNHLSDLQASIMRLNVSPSQNHGSRSRPDQSQDNRAPRPNGQRPSFECYYCGIRGHRIIECRKKMRGDDGLQLNGRGRGRNGGYRNNDTSGAGYRRDNRRRDDSPRDHRRRNDNRDYRRRDDSPRDQRRNSDFQQRRHDESPRRRDNFHHNTTDRDNTRRENHQWDERSTRTPPGSPPPSGNARLWAD